MTSASGFGFDGAAPVPLPGGLLSFPLVQILAEGVRLVPVGDTDIS